MSGNFFSDIVRSGWVEDLPLAVQPYARLMRLDRPIGTWLLLLPCWLGTALASDGLPKLSYMLLFAFGAVVMRGAGCVINDIYDRELDQMVERTRVRPLASGEVELWQAAVFLAVLLVIGFGVLLLFNRLTVVLGACSLILVFTYPLMKRITYWPQLFLGFTFNWGILLGGAVVQDKVSLPIFIAYAAGILWTLGYDTIYAHQDARDDMMAGIKSTALLFEEDSLRWVTGFYTGALMLLLLAGSMAGLGGVYRWGLAFAACYILVRLILWRMEDPASSLRCFKSNRDFGLIILTAIIIDRLS